MASNDPLLPNSGKFYSTSNYPPQTGVRMQDLTKVMDDLKKAITNGSLALSSAISALPSSGLTSVLTADNDGGGLDIENVANLRDSTGDKSVDIENRQLIDSTGGVFKVDWEVGVLVDSNGQDSVDWENRELKDSSLVAQFDYENFRFPTLAGGGPQNVTIDNSGNIGVGAITSGDVVGPASAINNNIAVFDGVTGKLIKDGGSTIAAILTTGTLGSLINGATSATPNDTDLVMSVEASVAKKNTWTQIKAFLKTYFDTVYTTTAAVATQITTALSGYLTSATAALTYQVILISGTNIKTINSSSILGAGDLTVTAGDLVYANTSVPAGNTIANQSGSDVAFASSYTIPANTVSVGNVIRVRAAGVYGTDGLLAPTIVGKLKIGSITLASTGTVTSVVGATNRGWTAFVDFVVTTSGAAGVVESQGFAEFATAVTTALTVNMVNTSAISGIDFTANQTLTITINWGTSDTDNTITLRQMMVYLDEIVVTAPTSTVTTDGVYTTGDGAALTPINLTAKAQAGINMFNHLHFI